jgi:hypothetical protein
MDTVLSTQGRDLTEADLAFIRRLRKEHPDWSRRRLSREICDAWQWINPAGMLKDIACRTLLRKLQERGLITLPAPRHGGATRVQARKIPDLPHHTEPIEQDLKDLRPITLVNVHQQPEFEGLFACLTARYHYLSFKAPVGENMAYVAFDRHGRELGCLLFGAAAWKSQARDQFIGWDAPQREAKLSFMTNNTRFLILPNVRVPSLASHLLGMTLRRINADWQVRYAHPIHVVETFVDTSRFRGTCYQAANFQLVGHTTGRTRQDRYNRIQVPIKAIYVYVLDRGFRTLWDLV